MRDRQNSKSYVGLLHLRLNFEEQGQERLFTQFGKGSQLLNRHVEKFASEAISYRQCWLLLLLLVILYLFFVYRLLHAFVLDQQSRPSHRQFRLFLLCWSRFAFDYPRLRVLFEFLVEENQGLFLELVSNYIVSLGDVIVLI